MRHWALAGYILVAACAGGESTAETGLSAGNIERSGKPNDFLVCPPDACDAADQVAPTYAITAEELSDNWLEIIDEAPRTTIVRADSEAGKIHAEQRSRVFGFVDTVLIEIIKQPKGSTFIAYSRSETGSYDFGVNRRRLEDWIAQLNEMTAEQN